MRLLAICLLVFSFGGCQDNPSAITGKSKLTGSWILKKWTSKLNDGSIVFPYGENAFGKLIYEPNGQMSVILMAEDRQLMTEENVSQRLPEETLAAFNTFYAYAGTYVVFPDSGYVIHKITACINPNRVGTNQKRFYKFKDHTLILSTPPIEVIGTKNQSTEQVLEWQKQN